jgi:hypothetical protein
MTLLHGPVVERASHAPRTPLVAVSPVIVQPRLVRSRRTLSALYSGSGVCSTTRCSPESVARSQRM